MGIILGRYLSIKRPSRRKPPHFILKAMAMNFLQELGYSVGEEVPFGHRIVDILGELGNSVAVVECGKVPIWRMEKLYRDKEISRLYWWKYNKAKPFTLRLCMGCSDTIDLLNGGYPKCCDLPRRQYLVNRDKEYCPMELINSLDITMLEAKQSAARTKDTS